MKKLTRIICLTLAMLMLMSTGAFALTYRTVPKTEDFSEFLFGTDNAYNVFRADNTNAAEQNYNTLSGRDWSSSEAKSGVNNLGVRTAMGLAGKSMEDTALYFRPSNTSYAGTTVQFFLNLGSEDITVDGTGYDATYAPTANNTSTFEFDYLAVGDHSKVGIYFDNLNGTAYRNSWLSSTFINDGVVNTGYKKDEVAVSRGFEKGRWYHITVVKKRVNSSKSSFDLYIDGEYIGQATSGMHRQAYRAKVELTPGAVSTNDDKDLANYGLVIDNIKVSNGDVLSSWVAPSVATQAGGTIIVDAETKTITVPCGTTVAELRQNVLLTNTATDRLRVYENNEELTKITYKTDVEEVGDTYFAANDVLAEGNILTVENTNGNGYAYYTIAVEEGFVAKQAGEVQEGTFASLTDDINITYADTVEETGTRMMLVGVYNADGKLVKAYTSGATATTFPAGEQTSLTVTVPAADLAGLTTGAKVRAFIWTDMNDIQPVETQFIDLTYQPAF